MVMSIVILINNLSITKRKIKEELFIPYATFIIKDQNGKVMSTCCNSIAEIEANPYRIMGR